LTTKGPITPFGLEATHKKGNNEKVGVLGGDRMRNQLNDFIGFQFRIGPEKFRKKKGRGLKSETG